MDHHVRHTHTHTVTHSEMVNDGGVRLVLVRFDNDHNTQTSGDIF